MDDSELQRLRAVVREMGSILVAYSGGVDSALLLTVAVAELGDGAAALTAISPSLPESELAESRAYADSLGVRHILVHSREQDRPGYQENAGNRCFHCKSELFDLTSVEAERFGYRWVADGTIADDFGEHRPGLAAASAHGVRHPLAEVGLTKSMVRRIARDLGVPVWAKPSAPCVASRIAVGTRVTPLLLSRVVRAEAAIRALGFRIFRLRIHALGNAELARLEIALEEWPRVTEPGIREQLTLACREEGFSWITLDLEGYRRGSVAQPLASATAPNGSPPVPNAK
jgi:uncharacterized protein